MEAARTSETSVNFNQTTRHNIPEDNHLYTRRRENLKSVLFVSLSKKKKSEQKVEVYKDVHHYLIKAARWFWSTGDS
jgi:hypothetical protein